MQRLAVKKTKTKAQPTTSPALAPVSKRKIALKSKKNVKPINSHRSFSTTTTLNSPSQSTPTIQLDNILDSNASLPNVSKISKKNGQKGPQNAKRAQKLSVVDQISTLSKMFRHNSQDLLSTLATTSLSPFHPLSEQGPLRKIKGLLAQQTLVMAAAMGLASDKATPASDLPPPSTLNPTDLPTTLPPPVNPLRKLQNHGEGDLAAAGIQTTTPAPDATLTPLVTDFIPPTPSRTIPIVHDGIEWDEPNFLFRPFIHAIDLLHEHTGMPWWGTLVAWAWILRTSISPLTYKQQASTIKLTLLQPEVLKLNQELRALDPKSNSFKAKQQEIADLYKKNGVGPFTAVFWSMSSIPFYVLSFIAIRNMANSPYFASEFSTGGFFPYTNLTASAGWELALVNALVNLIVIHVSQPIPVHKMQKLQKIMFAASHVLILGFIPILSNINTGSLMYFIANNSFSIFFQVLLYTNTFRKVAGLPTNAEVNAVRDLVTEMQKNQSNGRANPEGMKKGAYILEGDKKVDIGKVDVLDQARAMVNKKEEEKRTFALGGAAAVQAARLEAEKQNNKAKTDAAKIVGLSKEDQSIMERERRLQDFKRGVIPGKGTYQITDSGPKPEKVGGAKVVARKNWKKH